MTRIFFYGLFMDPSLLMEKGLRPKVLGPAVLPEFRIHVGGRATLIPSTGKRAYGVVVELVEGEARTLYSEESVRAYLPEPVRVGMLDSGEAMDAECYNLPPESGTAGTNPAYALQLSRLAERMGFDPGYIAEIAAFGEGS